MSTTAESTVVTKNKEKSKDQEKPSELYQFCASRLRCKPLLLFICIGIAFVAVMPLLRFTIRYTELDIVPYEVKAEETFERISTPGFQAVGNIMTGLQTLIFKILGIRLQNNVLINQDGMHVKSALETNTLKIGSLKMKGDTLFLSDSESDEFTLSNPLTISGENRNFSAMEVECSGFIIREKILYNARGEIISWPEPGDSRNSGKEIRSAVLLSDGAIPYIGKVQHDLCSDSVIEAKCENITGSLAQGFACRSGDSITLYTCNNMCCSDVSSYGFHASRIDKFEVFGDRKLAILTGNELIIVSTTGERTNIDHVTDIGAAHGKLLYARDFVLYVWNEEKSRVIARGVSKFTASEYRQQIYVVGDCVNSVKIAEVELVCAKPQTVFKLSNKEQIVVYGQKLMIGDDILTELDENDRVNIFKARDNRPVLAIFGDSGVKFRKVLKSRKLTSFTLTDDPVTDMQVLKTDQGPPVLIIARKDRILIHYCTNDLCIPDVTFQ